MIYLAQPYSHPSRQVRLARYKIGEFMTWRGISVGEIIFAPIVHFHKLAENFNLPGEFEFWKTLDEGFLKFAYKIRVLELPGHRESKGLQHEIEFAKKLRHQNESITWNEIQQHCAEYRDAFEDRPMLYWVNILNEAAKI